MTRSFAAPAIALAALMAPVTAPAQPSFDCGAARTATERAICASPDLASLEMRMVGVYDDLADRIGEAEARRIADIQLERRQACNGDAACIERQLLTTIGIFRAEAAAATRAAESEADAADEDLAELRAALGQGQGQAQFQGQALVVASAEDDDATRNAARRHATFEAAFKALPDYRRRHVQGRLRDAGLLEGPVDGIWGDASAQALDRFLRAARGRGIAFMALRPEGAAAALRYIGSDLFFYDYIPEAAR